ncbi:Hypothetical protein AKJ09_00851 [Labilithrix luteola]|uniref:DUF2452 domain-containing protein n=1 Tax=Labilithrix luteola TaxID=1391654 RepID=A0A0K1PKY9_9BACT|nr:Hypothetical protein AKJ09_00851 [Labilithrix luteola]
MSSPEVSGEGANAPRPLTREPSLPDAGIYSGAPSAAPYPLSRMAPSFDLVDVAAEIQKADAMLATVAGGKLGVIADQIRHLQDEARALLERARRDAELHRARCNFEKKPGGVYHLYRKDDGERWFSLFAPSEWIRPQPQTFEGSYRLEADMSFTRIDGGETRSARETVDLDVRALLTSR